MKIWIVNQYAIPPSLGGLVRHYYFSKYLQQKGHEVKIFTSSKIHNSDVNLIEKNKLFQEIEVDGIEYTFIKSKDYKSNGLSRIINLINFPFRTWKTMKRNIKEKPDIIYTSSPSIFLAFFAIVFGKRNKIKTVLEIRDLWPESVVEYKSLSKKNPIILILYRLEKWIYKNADKIIFTFPGGKDYIVDKHWNNHIDLSKIHYVNNGVDIEEFEYNLENFKTEDTDLENENIFKVIYMGSIRMANGLEFLIESFKYLKEYKNIKLYIYGEGTEKNKLEKLATENQLNVVFKGKVEKKKIPYILSKSNLNIINGMKTNIGKYGSSWNKLFEYIASEKPILSNIPSNYDFIKDFNLGVSKSFKTPEEYSREIIKFANKTPKENQRYSENMQKIKEEYDYKYLTEKLEIVFLEIAK